MQLPIFSFVEKTHNSTFDQVLKINQKPILKGCLNKDKDGAASDIFRKHNLSQQAALKVFDILDLGFQEKKCVF